MSSLGAGGLLLLGTFLQTVFFLDTPQYDDLLPTALHRLSKSHLSAESGLFKTQSTSVKTNKNKAMWLIDIISLELKGFVSEQGQEYAIVSHR